MIEFKYGARVRDTRDNKEYIMISGNGCGGTKPCAYIKCQQKFPNLTITKSIHRSFLELVEVPSV